MGSGLRFILFGTLGLAAFAQSTQNTPISFSVSGTGTSDSGTVSLTGSGNLQPFGSVSAAVTIVVGTVLGDNTAFGSVSYTFTLPSGATLQANDSSSSLVSNANAGTATGTATITGGTGTLSGATGSLMYSLNGQGADGFDTFSASGSGTLTLPFNPANVELQIEQSSVLLQTQSNLQQTIQSTINALIQNVSSHERPASTAVRPDATLPGIPFSASASTNSSVNWLSVSPTSGTTSGAVQTFTVTADPTKLGVGVYEGMVSITTASKTHTVPVTLTISGAQQRLILSQFGAQFVVASGAMTPSQTVFVSAANSGSLPFTTSVSTLSGGNWLLATPSSGIATAGTPADVSLTVNSNGLTPGDYYGSVGFTAAGAANSPQAAEVTLRVLASNANPSPVITPTGLIFVANGSNPASQSAQVFNPSNQPSAVSTTSTFNQAASFFTATGSGATAISGQPVVETVSVTTAGLMPGIYTGALNIKTAQDGVTHPVEILLLVTSSSSGAGSLRERASGCTPKQLLPVFTMVGANFTTVAAWPTALEVAIIDDCGSPLTKGSVVASFSTGDPPVSLTSTGSGQWAGTWEPHNAAGGPATITVNATSFSPALQGSASISGSLTANAAVPVIGAGGVVSAASFAGNAPAAPGSFISIFGSHLATALTSSASLPLATALSGTQVVLGGQVLPLQFVSGGQINAIIPYGAAPNVAQQILVQQNSSYSLPETVVLAAAQPAVFTQNQSGSGAGIIVVVTPQQMQFEATPATPATAGDALVIYCAGLGAVNPPIPDGSPAPSTPLSNTVNAVTVTIGGQAAQVFFAGLAPGFAGLYQVNVIVPSGVPTGPNVPVILTVAGASSAPVTVAIQ